MAEQQISMGMQYQAWLDMKQKLEEIEIKLNEQTYEDGAALTKLTGRNVAQVIEREVRTSDVFRRNVKVPNSAKGCVIFHVIYELTGTFAEGEGFSLSSGLKFNTSVGRYF